MRRRDNAQDVPTTCALRPNGGQSRELLFGRSGQTWARRVRSQSFTCIYKHTTPLEKEAAARTPKPTTTRPRALQEDPVQVSCTIQAQAVLHNTETSVQFSPTSTLAPWKGDAYMNGSIARCGSDPFHPLYFLPPYTTERQSNISTIRTQSPERRHPRTPQSPGGACSFTRLEARPYLCDRYVCK